MDLDRVGIGDIARDRAGPPALDLAGIGDANDRPARTQDRSAVVEIDFAGIVDVGQIAEHAGAGNGPGAAQLVVEGRGGNRDVAVDVTGVVDGDGAAGLEDGVSRRDDGRCIIGPDRAGIVDQNRGQTAGIHGDRRQAARAGNMSVRIVGDVNLARRVKRLGHADADATRAGDVTVIGDGDVAGAIAGSREAACTGGGAVIGDVDVTAAEIEHVDRSACGRDRGIRAGRHRNRANAGSESRNA